MVSFRPIYLAVVLGAGIVMLSACEDPSAVGLDLVGTDGGVPVVQRVEFGQFTTAPVDGVVENATVMLAGDVNDPVVGRMNAVGYIDFLENLVLTQAYKDGPIDGLLLRLEKASVYGDTSQTMTFALHEVLDEFTTTGMTPENLPPVGPEILQFSMQPNDDVVLIPLPASFYEAERDTTFRSTTFGQSFHGFQIRPVSGSAIIGFYDTITSQSNLRGIVGTDTVTFLATKGLSAYTRVDSVAVPPGLTVLQQGIGPNLLFDFDVNAFEGQSINRAALEITMDTLVFANDPPGFVRPELESLVLYGVIPDQSPVILAVGAMRDDDVTMDFTSPTFRQALQSILLGADPFDHYELRFLTTTGNTLDTIVLHDTSSVSNPPRLFVTSTPLN
ncbi:MAG: hypothetical protein R2834_08410 [Rhodothermales bacterium]